MHDEKKHGKWIPGYEGMYSITTDGEVWSFKKWRGRTGPLQLSLGRTREGYSTVHLCKKGRRFARYVHRVVMETYVGPCPEGMLICHNNGDPADNRLSNLRHGTPVDNAADVKLHGRQCGRPRSLSEKEAKEIKAHLKRGGPSGFQASLARKYGISPQLVCCIKKGRKWADV